MTTSDQTPVRPDELPATVRAFLTAHAARDVGAAAATFHPDAVVTDQGETFRGSEGVLRFLRSAGSEFTYTTELVAASRAGADGWVATNRLEGDFPGGVAELPYRFALAGDLIRELRIGG